MEVAGGGRDALLCVWRRWMRMEIGGKDGDGVSMS